MEKKLQPTHWYVTVSVRHAETGELVPFVRHDCCDRLHARILISNLRVLAADLDLLLPGLVVTGYELCTPQSQY